MAYEPDFYAIRTVSIGSGGGLQYIEILEAEDICCN